MNDDSATYEIIRFYEDLDRHPRVMRTGLTREQAVKHCEDPETSSYTAKHCCHGSQKLIDKWHNEKRHWFDSFTPSNE